MADQSNNKNNNNQGIQPRARRDNRQGQASRDRSRSPSQDTRRRTRDRSPIRDSGPRNEAPHPLAPRFAVHTTLPQQGNPRAGHNSTQRGGAEATASSLSFENGLMGIASCDEEGDQTLIYSSRQLCNATGVSRIAFTMLPLQTGEVAARIHENPDLTIHSDQLWQPSASPKASAACVNCGYRPRQSDNLDQLSLGNRPLRSGSQASNLNPAAPVQTPGGPVLGQPTAATYYGSRPSVAVPGPRSNAVPARPAGSAVVATSAGLARPSSNPPRRGAP